MLLLLAAWAAVLVPSIGARRFASSPINGVRSFEKIMGALATTRSTARVPGRWVMVPPAPTSGPRTRRSRLIRKRRLMLQRLLTAVAITLVLGTFMKSFFLLNLVLDGALVLYIAQLRRWRLSEMRARAAARRVSAGTISVHAAEPEPARVVPLDEPDRVIRLEDDTVFERLAASYR